MTPKMGSLTNRRESAALSARWIAFGALISCVSLAFFPSPASAREHRSHAVTREFQREHPWVLAGCLRSSRSQAGGAGLEDGRYLAGPHTLSLSARSARSSGRSNA